MPAKSIKEIFRTISSDIHIKLSLKCMYTANTIDMYIRKPQKISILYTL